MTQKVTNEHDMIAAERRHVHTQLIKIAKWAVHHKHPHTPEEIQQYNKRIAIMMRRRDYLDYLLQQKEKE